jgi:hypothetical protein
MVGLLVHIGEVFEASGFGVKMSKATAKRTLNLRLHLVASGPGWEYSDAEFGRWADAR